MSKTLLSRLQGYVVAVHEHLRPMAQGEGLLFQCKNGRAWKEDKVRQKKLYPLLDALGIERKGLHAFRHFNAMFGNTG